MLTAKASAVTGIIQPFVFVAIFLFSSMLFIYRIKHACYREVVVAKMNESDGQMQQIRHLLDATFAAEHSRLDSKYLVAVTALLRHKWADDTALAMRCRPDHSQM